jgi:hypothetical protein
MSAGPALRCYMNLMALRSLPITSRGFRAGLTDQLDLVASSGYTGVQFAEAPATAELAECVRRRLRVCASGRVNKTHEAADLAKRLADEGSDCGTVHLGWGLEDDAEACGLIQAVIEAAERWRVPLYIETHRATVCQDMWRTVQFVSRFPEIRFNGDFSHWYAGQEMVYGDFQRKFAFIQPVIERVRFVHGRIANPGCIQVPLVTGEANARHFEQLWTACFGAFIAQATADQHMIFAPELLGPDIFYARVFGGSEESDRWDEMLLLKGMAEQCFASAQCY